MRTIVQDKYYIVVEHMADEEPPQQMVVDVQEYDLPLFRIPVKKTYIRGETRSVGDHLTTAYTEQEWLKMLNGK